MLSNSQKSSKEKQKIPKQHSTTSLLKNNKIENKSSSQQEKYTLSKSKSKLSCKMNLESIIEQSSS
jgi:hypothetical protein